MNLESKVVGRYVFRGCSGDVRTLYRGGESRAGDERVQFKVYISQWAGDLKKRSSFELVLVEDEHFIW